MANEQVRIDLTATDKASDKIDDVADAAEALEKLEPDVSVGVDDQASTVIADVRDDAEALARLEPEVVIGVDDNASTAIADVRDDAEALARADHELVLKARIDAARGELKTLRTDLEQTADKASEVDRRLDKLGQTKGPGLAGNAVSDMTGPLGDVSGAASDIAGVFDGFADVAASAGARVGLDAEKMAGAITGIGFAITAAAAVWAFYRQRQKAAREAQEELVKGQRDFNKAVAEGDRAAAAAKFVELYEDSLNAVARFGVGAEEATRFIRGQSDALGPLDDEIARMSKAIDDNGGKLAAWNAQAVANLSVLTDTRDGLVDARDKYRDANGAIADQDRRLSDVARALGKASGNSDDFATSQDRVEESTRRVNAELERMRGDLDIEQAMNDFKRDVVEAMKEVGESALDQSDDVLALKQTVIDMGEDLKRNPLEIATVLEQVDAGELGAVAREVEAWYRAYPVTIASRLDRPGQISGGLTGTSGAGPRSVDTPSIGVLNMTLPTGWRGDPIRAAHVARRRSGRYYARTS